MARQSSLKAGGASSSGWLRSLVAHLDQSELGAVTGYRWFTPAKASVANALVYSMNCDVISLLTRSSHYLIWGGSWAIRREVFERIGLHDAWQGTLSDDLVASRLLVHGLHPHDVHRRVNDALDSVRPYLGSHGGDVHLVEVADLLVIRQPGQVHGRSFIDIRRDAIGQRRIDAQGAFHLPQVLRVDVDHVPGHAAIIQADRRLIASQ